MITRMHFQQQHPFAITDKLFASRFKAVSRVVTPYLLINRRCGQVAMLLAAILNASILLCKLLFCEDKQNKFAASWHDEATAC